ncbi:hypothetical protein MAR_037080 [Mya arenaria]|uniref:Uncharacterized protein n=1 Tax=Mya arenaria TaxID=6604 RepID=A0ABY7FW55_MYAAR|nr:hypothetical protein MAR_037080 [Mya arenaria]
MTPYVGGTTRPILTIVYGIAQIHKKSLTARAHHAFAH